MATLFHTDRKEAEAWFASETRELSMPDGTILEHADSRFVWRSFDFIVERGLFTPAGLASLVLLSAQERGESFASNFPCVLAYIHDQILKSLDDEDHDPVGRALRESEGL
jgi:hypothetical protein